MTRIVELLYPPLIDEHKTRQFFCFYSSLNELSTIRPVEQFIEPINVAEFWRVVNIEWQKEHSILSAPL